MQIKSWFEEFRGYIEEGEALEKERQEALAYEAKWRADNERLHMEDDIMHEYANCLMEKELKALGEYIIQKYPKKKDKWIIANAVYYQYGRYYMYINQPAEAITWFLKALKDKIPYPYKTWELLAAAYVETGEYKKADAWIKRYLAHYTKEGKIHYDDWANFAKYYLARGKYERALALFLEGRKGQEPYVYDKPYIARAYFGLGEYDKGFKLYEEFLERKSADEGDFADIALAYYNYGCDLERSEANYLKSVEAAADRDDARNWNQQIYNNLSIIFANEGVWDKCFHYLRLHYENKFEGLEADIFFQIIDQLPPIEDNEMGMGLYQAIRDFETSPLRPGGVKLTEGLVSDQPSAEVGGADQPGGDISGLFEWDESKSN